MTATLRVVLDQLVAPVDDDLAAASRGLAVALVASAPAGCEVVAVVPAAQGDAVDSLLAAVPGLADVQRAPLARRELAAAWQLGAASGLADGMVHSPTLMAPLVRHDRVHDHDQSVVTVWDLAAWERPDELPRAAATWQRAMLRRAVKHADAVVAPSHALAARLAETARIGDRVRVIAGAPAQGFARPTDTAGRLRTLALPPDYVVVAGDLYASSGLAAGLAGAAGALDADGALHVVVLGAGEGAEPAVADLAAAAGIPERRLHVRGALEMLDRAAVVGDARAYVAPARRAAYPWRLLEAMVLGVPVVAAASAAHSDAVADGGLLVGDRADPREDADALRDATARAVVDADLSARLRVLATDRSRAYSWREAAERVWQLHADL